MDKEDAKLALQAYRPNGEDAKHPVFAEAVTLVENDPELKAWWETQRSFDQKIAARLEKIPLPSHLRSTILSGRKIEKLTFHYRLPYGLAAAAALVLFLVAGFHPWTKSSSRTENLIPHREYTASVLQFMDHDPALGLMAHDHEKVLAWLRQKNSPVGNVPISMAALPSLGCQKFEVHGHAVSLICFSLAGGGLAHLFIIDQQALTDPPGSTPEFDQSGEWSTASWSDGTMSYVVATQAGADALKHLL